MNLYTNYDKNNREYESHIRIDNIDEFRSDAFNDTVNMIMDRYSHISDIISTIFELDAPIKKINEEHKSDTLETGIVYEIHDGDDSFKIIIIWDAVINECEVRLVSTEEDGYTIKQPFSKWLFKFRINEAPTITRTNVPTFPITSKLDQLFQKMVDNFSCSTVEFKEPPKDE